MRLFLLIILSLFFHSCAQVRSVSQTSIPLKRTHKVNAEVKKNIFFLFNFSTDYVDELHTQLRKKCPNGNVEGIITKDVTLIYFPVIFHQDHITAEGFCVK